ncbi:hypothetical protein ABIE45_001352 [Methylobacterium sp. OAE515]
MGHSAYDPATKGRPAWNAGLEAALRSLACERGPIEVLVYNAYRIRIRLPVHPCHGTSRPNLQANVVRAYAAARTIRNLIAPRGRGGIILTGGGLAIDPQPGPVRFPSLPERRLYAS